MVIIHVSQTSQIFPGLRTRDNPETNLTEAQGEDRIDYHIIAPNLKTALQALVSYSSAFTGRPIPTVEEIVNDAPTAGSALSKQITEAIVDVAAGKRPYWMVITRNSKIKP